MHRPRAPGETKFRTPAGHRGTSLRLPTRRTDHRRRCVYRTDRLVTRDKPVVSWALFGYRSGVGDSLSWNVPRRAGGILKENSLKIEVYADAVGIIVIRVAGDLQEEAAARLRHTLTAELAGAPRIVILDLTQVECIDADGIDTLHVATELTADEDIGLGLVAPAMGVVRAGLDAVDATDTFEIFTSVRSQFSWR